MSSNTAKIQVQLDVEFTEGFDAGTLVEDYAAELLAQGKSEDEVLLACHDKIVALLKEHMTLKIHVDKDHDPDNEA